MACASVTKFSVKKRQKYIIWYERILSLVHPVVYNKENLERQETNKYGRGTERHLPKTDESVVRPAAERR